MPTKAEIRRQKRIQERVASGQVSTLSPQAQSEIQSSRSISGGRIGTAQDRLEQAARIVPDEPSSFDLQSNDPRVQARIRGEQQREAAQMNRDEQRERDRLLTELRSQGIDAVATQTPGVRGGTSIIERGSVSGGRDTTGTPGGNVLFRDATLPVSAADIEKSIREEIEGRAERDTGGEIFLGSPERREAFITERLKQEQIKENLKKLQQEQDVSRTERSIGQTVAGQQSDIGQARSRLDSSLLGSITANLLPEDKDVGIALQNKVDALNEMEAAQREFSEERIDFAQDTFSDIRSGLARAEAREHSFQGALESALKEKRDRDTKFVEEQRANEIAKLTFLEDQIVRENKRALSKAIDSMEIVQAIGGRFGSASAEKEIINAERDGEQAISDLRKEFGYKRADLSLEYTRLVNQAEDNYMDGVINSLNNLKSALTNLDLQGANTKLQEAQLVDKAATEAFSSITDLRKQKAQVFVDAATFVRNGIAQQKLEDTKKQAEVFNRYKSILTLQGQLTDDQLGALSKDFKNVGLSTELLSKGPTVSLLNSLKKKESDSRIVDNIGRFVDKKTGTDMAILLSNSTLGLSNDQASQRQNIGLHLLETGQNKKFSAHLKSTILGSFDAPTQREIQNNFASIDAIDTALQSVTGLSNVDANNWKKFKEQSDNFTFDSSRDQEEYDKLLGRLRSGESLEGIDLGRWEQLGAKKNRLLNNPNNPEYVRLLAEMQFPLAKIRSQLFGANLTEAEIAFSQQFIADPTTENIADVKVKLLSMQSTLNNDLRSRYDTKAGYSGTYDNFIKQVPGPIDSPNYDNIFNEDLGNSYRIQEGENGRQRVDRLTSLDQSFESGLELLSGDRESLNFQQVQQFSGFDDLMSYFKDQGGVVTQDFHKSVNYIKGRNIHGGYDVALPMNTPLPSPVSGKVIKVSGDTNAKTGWGLNVLIEDSEGKVHRIAHLNRIPDGIKEGSKINSGDIIAFSGNSGFSTGPHLHYEVKKDGRLIDPRKTS